MIPEKSKMFEFPEKMATLFFLIAVFIKSAYFFYFPPLGTDQIMIHTAVDILLQGKGLTFPIANLQDLSIVHFQPMNEWPPLVGYLIYSVKAVVINTRATDMILMAFGTLLLLLAVRKIMKHIEISPIFQSILWIIIATNPEPFYRVGISDIYSCLCMLWGVSLCLGFVKTGTIKTYQLLIASIVFFLPAAFRYQYYPIIFICPLFLIIAGRILKQTDLFKKGKLSLLTVAMLLVTHISLLYFQTGSVARIAEDKIGIYFENLIHMYPFLVKGFLNTSYIENVLFTKSTSAMLMVNTLYFLLTAFLLYKIIRFLIFQYNNIITQSNNEKWALYLNKGFLLVVSLSIIFLLSVLSLIYSPQVNPYGLFTYIKEGRYFLVPTLLLVLLTTSILQEYLSHLQIQKFKFYKTLIVFIILFNFSLFGKFCYNIISGKQKIQGSSWTLERKTVFEKITNQIQIFKRPTVLVGNNYFSYQPIAENYGILKELKQLETAGIKTTKPILLLIITQPKLSIEEEKFIYEKNALLIFNGKKCRMYQLLIGS